MDFFIDNFLFVLFSYFLNLLNLSIGNKHNSRHKTFLTLKIVLNIV